MMLTAPPRGIKDRARAAPIWQAVRRVLRVFMPGAFLEARKRIISCKKRIRYSQLSVGAAFSEIYRTGAWGGNPGTFFSGRGSVDAFSIPYCQIVAAFVQSHSVSSIVDIGCGDFRVGSTLLRFIIDEIQYTGIDIVPDLVAYNQTYFEDATVRFHCLDVIEDKPPAGTLCLLRQVLQHLSNSEISRVLSNCAEFRYLLVTEHVAVGKGSGRPNIDKSHGPDTRIDLDGSGVFIDKPPFSLSVSTLLEIPCGDNQVLRTVLIEREA
jgi:SAM-dependent methyltransferase